MGRFDFISCLFTLLQLGHKSLRNFYGVWYGDGNDILLYSHTWKFNEILHFSKR